jgi:hypothetical protein
MSDRFTALLSDYLDHDLPRAEFEALERHLGDCDECREVLSSLAAVKSHAASLVDPPAPDDLWAGIASRIGSAGSPSAAPRPVLIELPRRARIWSTPQWLAAAAAFAVVAMAAVWLAQGGLNGRATREGLAVRQGSPPSYTDGGTDASAAGFDAERIENEIQSLQAPSNAVAGGPPSRPSRCWRQPAHHPQGCPTRVPRPSGPGRELQDYLAGSVQRKLDLVRRAADLAGV